MRRWDAAGLPAVSRASDGAVATGENLTGLEQYRQLLDADAVGIVQAGTSGASRISCGSPPGAGRDLPVSPVAYDANPVAHASVNNWAGVPAGDC